MKSNKPYRYLTKACHSELAESLTNIISIQSYKRLTGSKLKKILNSKSFKNPQKRWAKFDVKLKILIAIIYSPEHKKLPIAGISIITKSEPEELDIAFINTFCRVFNEDLITAPKLKEDGALWQTLRQTQFQRAIAKFSAFSTSNMTKLLQVVEHSTSLRHEGKPFSYCLFLTKKEKWIKTPLGNMYIPFAERIPYAKGLLSEDWIRAAIDGNRVGLVALGRSHELVAMFNVPPFDQKSDWIFAPHESVIPLQKYLVDGTALFIVSIAGDVYILLPNGATFCRTQGTWRYLNYLHFFHVLTQTVTKRTARSILRMALDLSFERHGALIVALDKNSSVGEVIKDHSDPNRVNSGLRDTICGLNLHDWTQRQIVLAASKSDGALIVSTQGEVLDVACMIGDPSDKALQRVQVQAITRYAGARSTAAWNASIFGTAIKISEDGPITMFRHGKPVASTV